MGELEGGPKQRAEIRIVVDDQDGERLFDAASNLRRYGGPADRVRQRRRSHPRAEPRVLFSLVDFGEPPESD
jgi:hypothetical protein